MDKKIGCVNHDCEKCNAQEKTPVDGATLAGLHASISILSALVDEQRALLVEVEDVCGRDGHGAPLEDGESSLIDKVRAHISAIAPSPPQRKWVGLTDDHCTWKQHDDFEMTDTWEAACGAMWTFSEGSPKDNDMHYCPNCGKPAIEAANCKGEQA